MEAAILWPARSMPDANSHGLCGQPGSGPSARSTSHVDLGFSMGWAPIYLFDVPWNFY